MTILLILLGVIAVWGIVVFLFLKAQGERGPGIRSARDKGIKMPGSYAAHLAKVAQQQGTGRTERHRAIMTREERERELQKREADARGMSI